MPTPSDPGPSHDGPPLEPVRVLRPRRTDALAEMFREFERERLGEYESVTLPRPPTGAEEETQELPPVAPEPAGRPPAPAPGPAARRTAVAVAVAAAAVLGFGGAVLLLGLLGDHTDDRAAAAPRPSASPPVSAPAAPPEPGPARPGFLSEGDAGPEVTELQERLLRIPDVYRDGATSGRYDATLTAAVARFQLWYGIQGDETGVYGDDTRLALESRTG
ncbi:peptidoglycan-binding domain-containing protein [Streptomyces cathayae]|uniref:Peptidoglycan-binding domain-containing protein n=1 Tax=Streptomyces cathayae TaxID=3031124 RepID=A0ABY8JUN8_9ACTN|nr:peptidoglycan-binding domain-containing protein [Streptomyces sp. HUAS 5]WGD38909.1 peptidoglycan-binding domain-containing protein [Streptomyces sp. HUAS 5]